MKMLKKQYGSIVRAWRIALDKSGDGKLTTYDRAPPSTPFLYVIEGGGIQCRSV